MKKLNAIQLSRSWTLLGMSLILSLAPQMSNAAPSLAEECLHYSDRRAKLNLQLSPPDKCVHWIHSEAKDVSQFSDGGALQIYGYKRVLMTHSRSPDNHKPSVNRMLSGPETGLHEIAAITVWREQNAVFALDKEAKAIMLFSYLLDGDLSPSLELRNAAFEFATALAFDPGTKTLFVLFGDERKVATFRVPAQRGDVEAERLVDLDAQGIASMNQIAFAAEDLLVLDRGSSKLARFPLGKLLSTPPSQTKQPALVAKEILPLPSEAANAKALTLEGIASQVYASIPGKLIPLTLTTRKPE